MTALPLDEEFETALSSSMRSVADSIVDLVVASSQTPDPQSPAGQEAGQFRSRVPDTWGQRFADPFLMIAVTLYTRLLAAADYLRGIAIVASDEGRGQQSVSYSAAALARGALEALAFAYWMAEPGVGDEERVRRLALDIQHDHKQRRRIVEAARADGVEPVIDAQLLADMCDDFRVPYEWGTHKPTGIGLPEIKGKERPSAMAILTPVMPSKEHANIGAVVYHLMTNVAHASTQGLLGTANISRPNADGITIEFTRNSILRQVAGALWAVPKPTLTACEYLGWKDQQFKETFAEAAVRLSGEED